MKKQTLLEKAKAFKRKRKKISVTDEQMELAIAWMKGEITTVQARNASDKKHRNNIIARIAHYLKEAYRKNKIKD